MDYTNDNRQQRFRDRMKESGKKQRVFYLSDQAMDALKKRKEDTQSPSLNHTLESLLTTDQVNWNVVEKVVEKIVEVPAKISERDQKILEAARELHKVSSRYQDIPEGDQARGCPEFCVNGVSLRLQHPIFELDTKPV